MFKSLLLLYVFHLITIFGLGYIIWKRDEMIQSILDEFIVVLRTEMKTLNHKKMDSEIIDNANAFVKNNLPFL